MDKAQIFERIRVLMAKKLELDPQEIELDSLLVDDLDADSLDLLELVISLKDQFGIQVFDGEVKQLLVELARFLPDEVRPETGGAMSDEKLAFAVSQRLRVSTIVEMIADRSPTGA